MRLLKSEGAGKDMCPRAVLYKISRQGFDRTKTVQKGGRRGCFGYSGPSRIYNLHKIKVAPNRGSNPCRGAKPLFSIVCPISSYNLVFLSGFKAGILTALSCSFIEAISI